MSGGVGGGSREVSPYPDLCQGLGVRVGSSPGVLPPADPQVEQEQAQVGFAAHAQFFQHMTHMGFHGLGGYPQNFSDLTVGVTADRVPGDLLFARCERLKDRADLGSRDLLLQPAREQLGREGFRGLPGGARRQAELVGEFGVNFKGQTLV